MRSYKATTPSRRGTTTISFREHLTSARPHKAFTKGLSKKSGRSSSGRISTRHKGGGHKRRFRDVDFLYNKKNIPAVIESVEYDPNRSSFISLVCYRDGERRYVLTPKGTRTGDVFTVFSEKGEIKTGNRMPLKYIPVGTFVYNVELKPGNGGKIIRSAGSYAEVVSNDAGYTSLKMPSTEIRKVLEYCFASIGQLSNDEHRLVSFGKAGRSRWMGIRPTVRGTAMNPVDHPHGGGEGRQGRGRRRAVSKWGKPTGKGQKTRSPKKYSNSLIVSRRKVGKKA